MIQRTKEEQLFWALPTSKVIEILETDARGGLSESEAERRIKIFGSNVIEKPRRAPGLFIFHFKTVK